LGLGFGVWVLGCGGMAPNPQPPIPNPQSPIPIRNKIFLSIIKLFLIYKNIKLKNLNKKYYLMFKIISFYNYHTIFLFILV